MSRGNTTDYSKPRVIHKSLSISFEEEFRKKEDKKSIDPTRKKRAIKYTKMLLGIKLFLQKESHAF